MAYHQSDLRESERGGEKEIWSLLTFNPLAVSVSSAFIPAGIVLTNIAMDSQRVIIYGVQGYNFIGL